MNDDPVKVASAVALVLKEITLWFRRRVVTSGTNKLKQSAITADKLISNI